MKALLGTKIGMTQIISQDGTTIPVTLIQAGPVAATQVKSVETDGYNAVQVAYGAGKNLSKAVAGHVKPAGVTPKHIREFRVDDLGDVKVGDTWSVTEFALGDVVDVTGISKGKGWAGTIKRHNFKRTAKPTVVRVIRVRSVRSVACTHKRFSKGSAWQARWATSVSLSRI